MMIDSKQVGAAMRQARMLAGFSVRELAERAEMMKVVLQPTGGRASRLRERFLLLRRKASGIMSRKFIYDIRTDDDDQLLPEPYACWIALDRLPVLPGLYAILCRDPDGRQWLRYAYYDGTRESLGENAVAYASTHPRIVYRTGAEDAN